LEGLDAASDIWPCVIVHARKDVRRASDDSNALGCRHAGHRQGGFKVRRAVVYPGDYMAVKIKQRRQTSAFCTGHTPRSPDPPGITGNVDLRLGSSLCCVLS
jgi:hypothetical protein